MRDWKYGGEGGGEDEDEDEERWRNLCGRFVGEMRSIGELKD